MSKSDSSFSKHPAKGDKLRYRMEKHAPKSLPYYTKSVCPDCHLQDDRITVIDATVIQKDGVVKMLKSCDIHGAFEEIYWSDVEMFTRVMNYWYKTIGLYNPRTASIDGCPNDCGQCEAHCAHTALGLIDVTNRCNLKCSICFANAAASGIEYEPTPTQVYDMMVNLRSNLPAPCAGLQFAGGEPTLSENMKQYVSWASELGFRHIMIATNGVRMANNPEYLKELVDVGLKTIYLQFDGVTEKPYLEARGSDLREMKDQVLDSARYANLDGVILVPTIVRGLNDDQLGDIVQYALDNRDIVRCINFQPVSLTGRIDHTEREKIRITTPDAIALIEEQTQGRISRKDWYPVSSMMGVGRAMGLIRGEEIFELHSHYACGMATFLFVDDDGGYVPITKVVDIEKLLVTLENICNLYSDEKRFPGLRARLKLMGFLKHVKDKSFMKPIISSFLRSGTYETLRSFMSRVIMLGMMHFQDPYNIDLERVQHCTINYATPDGRIIPFCTYNNFHRPSIEEKYGSKAKPA